MAVTLARHDWILSVDSDEIVSPALRREIALLPLDPQIVYAIPFENFFNGKLITTCGWAPDRHERLFNRKRRPIFAPVRFTNAWERVVSPSRSCGGRCNISPTEGWRISCGKWRPTPTFFAEQHAGRK